MTRSTQWNSARFAGGLLIALFGVACASGVDFARKQRGQSECNKVAEKLCTKNLGSADQQACIKREVYLCELRTTDGE